MNIRSIKNSIRWKIVLIYCILVFIATTIVGVFLMSRMEEYYINSARTNMRKLVEESSLTDLPKKYRRALMRGRRGFLRKFLSWTRLFISLRRAMRAAARALWIFSTAI